ncbi:MAG: YihY/virulence factor BrkB family protein, partial [Casimicrobiaceae bacterium]
RIASMFSTAFNKWIGDRAPSMGAALAYYTAFSIAPLLVIVIAIGGLTVGHDVAEGAIVAQLRDLLGDAGAESIHGMLDATSKLGTGITALTIGIAALFLGATTAFAELQDDLDRIWEAKPRSGSGIVNMIRTRLLSFGMVLCIAFLLTISLVVNAGIAATGKYLVGDTEAVMYVLNFSASVAVTTLLFAAIYKILPNATIAWKDVWEGALITAVLFAVGKTLIGLYIGKADIGSAFGSAGPFVVLMVWIYYSTQIFLFGAEITCVVARDHGRDGSAPSAAVASSIPGRLNLDAATQASSGNAVGGPAPSPALSALANVDVARSHLPSLGGERIRKLLGASATGALVGWVLTRIALSRVR